MFEEKAIKIFSSRDKIRDELIKYAEKYLDIQDLDLSKTDYLSYLINVLSILTSNLIYYNSSVYREFFLIKAQQKESVLNLAAMLGYSAENAVPANTQVIIQMDADFKRSTSIILYGRTEPQDPNGDIKKAYSFYAKEIIFSLQNTVEIQAVVDRGRLLNFVIKEKMPNGSIANIPWRMSSDKSKIYFSLGVVQAKDQYFDFTIPNLQPGQFYDKNIKFAGNLVDIELYTKESDDFTYTTTQGSYSVKNPYYTSWVAWDYKNNKNSIYLINSGDKAYSYRLMEDGLKIFWGNGVIGTPPPMGNLCRVKITTSDGVLGNVISGSITSADRMTGYDLFTVPNQRVTSNPVKFTVINQVPATGGRDYPSTDEIRTNAMVQVSANKRLVTQYDFENIKSIVEDLPINHSIPILKRSDIKQNEIVLFTDILYQDAIVPIRNEFVTTDTDTTTMYDMTTDIYGNYSYYVPAGTEFIFGEDSTSVNHDYMSMFDMFLDSSRCTASYSYLLKETSKEVIINSIERYGDQDRTIIFPSNTNFLVQDLEDVETDVKNLTITLSFRFIVRNKLISDSLSAWVQIGDSGEYRDMLRDTTSVVYTDETADDFFSSEHSFAVNIPIQYIPDGDVNFYINVNGGVKILTSGSSQLSSDVTKTYYLAQFPDGITTWGTRTLGETVQLTSNEISSFNSMTSSGYTFLEVSTILKCESNVVVRQDMSDFMYSQCFFDSTESNIAYIYDVPLIEKQYWTALERNDLLDDFINQIYNKIITFDITSYKMMTDFVNLKFSNTIGLLDNMKYNKTTIDTIYAIDPSADEVIYIENLTENTRVIVTNIDDNPFKNTMSLTPIESNIVRSYPFLAIWTGADLSPKWRFKTLITNDIFEMVNDMGSGEKYIFNGTTVCSVIKEIPLYLDIHMWLDKTYPSSENSILENVKNNLVEQLVYKTGYDKPMYRSQITRIVQQTPGVDHCIVLKPEHDIFFNYNIYKDFSQEQLIKYSPQLVQVIKDRINITIRSNR